MIDFHSHLVPGVDDGATDLAQSRSALEVMRAQGVRALVTTPHLSGSLTTQPERMEEFFGLLDPAWERFRELAAAEFPDLRVERGLEVMLDTPALDLSDARLRLAGTSFVLVEFPFLSVPPNSAAAIYGLRSQGWRPVIAHPERYRAVDPELRLVEEWRRVGGLLQVNCGSLVGRYGRQAQTTAFRLLRRGWVSYLSSDYHARGTCALDESRRALVEKGAEDHARLLLEENPGRLIEDRAPLEVPPLPDEKMSLWRRLLSLRRG
jgi:protein-tyrosine phosphatase